MALTPFQSEMESRSTTSAEQDRSKRLSDLNRLIDRMVSQAQGVTDRWITMWDEALNYAFNNQLANKKRKNGWPAIQLNMVWPAIKQEVAILSQRKPQVFAEPITDADTDKARWWSGNLQSRFERQRIGIKSIDAVTDGALTGWYIGYIYPDKKSYWDSEAQRWVYEPKMTLLNPRFFGMDPNAESLDDAMYVYCQRLVPVEWAIAQWPEMEDEILHEAQNIIDSNRHSGTAVAPKEDGTDKGTGDNAGSDLADLVHGYRQEDDIAAAAVSSTTDPRAQRVLITHIYFRDAAIAKLDIKEDYTVEELVEAGAVDAVRTSGPDGAPGTEVYIVKNAKAPELDGLKYANGDLLTDDRWPQKLIRTVEDAPKFPNGRYICRINKLILNVSDEEQKWDRKRWPFEIGLRLPLPHIPQGLSAVEMMKIAQDWVNVSASHLMNWLCYHGDPITIMQEGALPKGFKGRLKAIAGAIWNVADINKIQRQPAPPLANGIMETFNLVQRHAQDSSMHDTAMGGAIRGGNPTATEVAATQQATQVGLGLPMLLLDDWIARVMRQFAELDKLYLEPGDSVHMAGDEWPEGRVAEFVDEYRDIEFDIKLEVGTSLPFTVERKRNDLLTLQTGPAALFPNNTKLKEMTLDAFEIRDKKAVLAADAAYQQVVQFQQQMEAMAAQEQAADVGAQPPASAPVSAPPPGV